MSLKIALAKCIRLVEEDLRRYEEAQKADSRAFGSSESRTIKDYLTALSGAYRNAGGLAEGNPELEEVDTTEIEQELRDRMSND